MLQKGVSVDMAKVDNPTPMEDADKEDALLVSITRDGKVYFGTEQITTDNLTTKVKDRLANKQDKRVYVKADMRTRFGGVVQVVDSVRAAGVDDLGLLTDQRKTASKCPTGSGYAGAWPIEENDHGNGSWPERRPKCKHQRHTAH